MRLQLLLAAATAAVLTTACGYRVDDCDQPSQGFTLAEDLDEQTIDRLVQQNDVIDRLDLECGVVCESIYLDQNPRGGAQSVGACELTIDGEFTGDPEAIVGSLYCEGRGIPQFCFDA